MKCHTGAAKLLREDDEVIYGDSAYLGLEKRDEIKENPQLSAIEWERLIENRKSAVRCKAEWLGFLYPFCSAKKIAVPSVLLLTFVGRSA